jgi:hypothetical protein
MLKAHMLYTPHVPPEKAHLIEVVVSRCVPVRYVRCRTVPCILCQLALHGHPVVQAAGIPERLQTGRSPA